MVFHVSGCLRSFMICFKYDLLLWRYFSIDSVLFLPYYFKIQYNCYSKKYLLSLSHLVFLIAVSSIHFFSLISFCTLKRFLMYLIMVSSIFSSFYSLKLLFVLLLYYYTLLGIFLKKEKVHNAPLKNVEKIFFIFTIYTIKY